MPLWGAQHLAGDPPASDDTISYQLTKTWFSLNGNLNVAQSGVVSGVIGGIPAGTGYTLALTASDVGNKFASCGGLSMACRDRRIPRPRSA